MNLLRRFTSPALVACAALTASGMVAAAPPSSTSVAAERPAPIAPPATEPLSTATAAPDGRVMPPPLDRDAARADRYCVREGQHVVCRRYAELFRHFREGRRPTGVGATFSVHNPRDIRRGQHSLAEIGIRMPGALGNIVEVGWRRYLGRTRLFVYRWNNNRGSCYDRCGGFRVRGPGKAPGSVLRAGSNIRVEWRHHHRRWNLYVNGKWSGFYPDRLWNGRFHHVGMAQIFGEVSFFRNGVGRCVDMGNGRFPRSRSARVFKIRYVSTSAGYRGGRPRVSAPEYYNFKRTGLRSFKYGGPGPC